MFKELKETKIEKSKESMMTLSHQIENIKRFIRRHNGKSVDVNFNNGNEKFIRGAHWC